MYIYIYNTCLYVFFARSPFFEVCLGRLGADARVLVPQPQRPPCVLYHQTLHKFIKHNTYIYIYMFTHIYTYMNVYIYIYI